MKKELIVDKILPLLLVLAVIFLLTNVALIQIRSGKWSEAQEIVKEKLRPAELQIITLTAGSCTFCSDVDEGIEKLKSFNVNITEEKNIESTSSLGKGLIEKYSITKLPTFIVRGELNKSEQLTDYFESEGELEEEQFVYTAGKAPYYDVNVQSPVGLVKIFTLTDSSCPQCTDLSGVPDALKEQGVLLQTNKEVDFRSTEGQNLVTRYDIKESPALLISRDIEYYEEVHKQLLEAGASEKENYYAVHVLVPPYRDVETDKIVGLVDLTLLDDASCTECYDVEVNKQILANFGIVFKEQKRVDINTQEGKTLKEKYKIAKLPVAIMSPDAEAYPALVQAWRSVGSVEDDGWFVMRKPELLGRYKDLETNQVITPQQGR